VAETASASGTASIELGFVNASDGATSRVRIFRAESSRENAPVILCMPAMGVTARYYDPLGHSLRAHGLNAIVGELRGHGTSSVRASRRTNFGYREMVLRDWPALIDRAAQTFTQSPIVLLGHSLGGQLSALHCALEAESRERPVRVRGLALVASCSVHYLGWRFPHSIGLLAGTQSASLVARALGFFPGHRIGFGGREARDVMIDWARQSRTGRYALDGRDMEPLLARVEVPVLAVSVAGDEYAPPRAVDALCAKLERAPLERWHFDPRAMRLGSVDHFRWVKEPDPIAARVRDWIDRAVVGA
jgi:predicted alpha/beta hydrolase